MRKFKSIIGLFVFFIFCCSCNNTIESRIANRLKQCDSVECKINITEYTNFEWDTAYYFETPVSQAVINKIIGFKYQNYQEFTRPLIFIRNRKVVYYENNPSSIESLTKNQVVFNGLTDTTVCKIISSSNPVFKGYTEKNGEINYYRLEQM